MRFKKLLYDILDIQDPPAQEHTDPVDEARQTEFSYVVIATLLLVLMSLLFSLDMV